MQFGLARVNEARRAVDDADTDDQPRTSLQNDELPLRYPAHTCPQIRGAALNTGQTARIATRLCVIVVALVSAAVSAFATEADIRIVRQGGEVAALVGNRIAEKLSAVVESSTVDSTKAGDAEAAWTRAAGSGSFVHAVFSMPRPAKLNGHLSEQPKAIMIHEILLPMPEDSLPAHVFAKTEGNTILAFTKYDPLALRDLIAEADLQVRSIGPYRQLLTLPPK